MFTWCMFTHDVYVGSSMGFETEADGTDKCQPFEIKTEDITEHDDKPGLYLCTVCDKRFTMQECLNAHKRIHNIKHVY